MDALVVAAVPPTVVRRADTRPVAGTCEAVNMRTFAVVDSRIITPATAVVWVPGLCVSTRATMVQFAELLTGNHT